MTHTDVIYEATCGHHYCTGDETSCNKQKEKKVGQGVCHQFSLCS